MLCEAGPIGKSFSHDEPYAANCFRFLLSAILRNEECVWNRNARKSNTSFEALYRQKTMLMKTLEMKSLRNWKCGKMRENFKGFLKIRDISLMWAYCGTSVKMRTCPAQCGTVGKYGTVHSEKTHKKAIYLYYNIYTNIDKVKMFHVLPISCFAKTRRRSERGIRNRHQIIFRKVGR